MANFALLQATVAQPSLAAIDQTISQSENTWRNKPPLQKMVLLDSVVKYLAKTGCSLAE